MFMEHPIPPIVPNQIEIPESELVIDFVRSSGKGGQNVNKTSTKAQLRWNVDASAVFTPEQKQIIKEALAGRLNLAGEIIVMSQEERSQLQNKEHVIERLRSLVAEALIPEKERIATRPSRGSKERRLSEKKQVSRTKESRQWRPDED